MLSSGTATRFGEHECHPPLPLTSGLSATMTSSWTSAEHCPPWLTSCSLTSEQHEAGHPPWPQPSGAAPQCEGVGAPQCHRPVSESPRSLPGLTPVASQCSGGDGGDGGAPRCHAAALFPSTAPCGGAGAHPSATTPPPPLLYPPNGSPVAVSAGPHPAAPIPPCSTAAPPRCQAGVLAGEETTALCGGAGPRCGVGEARERRGGWVQRRCAPLPHCHAVQWRRAPLPRGRGLAARL